METAPASIEAWRVWQLVNQCSGQVRTAGLKGAVIGLDMGPVWSAATALGIDGRSVALLAPFIETGLVTAIAAQGENDG